MANNFIGKKIKVNDYEMNYGKKESQSNVLCFFKYLKDNNIYAVCCNDSDIPYGIIQYGSAYLKENTLILIGTKNPNQEMIKELMFKIYNREDLESFEVLDLENVKAIELMSPNKFEIKKEVLSKVVEQTIAPVVVLPKKDAKKKKKGKLFPILIIILVLIVIIFYFFVLGKKESEVKSIQSIVCQKEYDSDELYAKVTEDNTYYFNQNETLEYVNRSTTYQFYEEEDYLDFVNRGLYFSYLSDENTGFTLDDSTYSFVVIERDDVSTDYSLPTEYEEVLSYYKGEDYSCVEEIDE